MLPPLIWRPSPNISNRAPKVRLIVAHSCEGSYGGSVSWFTNRASNVSAHFVVKEDGSEIAQCVALDKVAWHVRSLNDFAIGCELAGWAVKGFSDAEWQTEARLIAYLLHLYGLPVQWARKGQGAGFCRHFDLRGIGGNSHVDPCTDDATWLNFVAQVQAAYAAGGFPSSWARGEPGTPVVASAAPPIHGPAWLQTAMNRLGADPRLVVDGDLGPRTKAALYAWQFKAELKPTGQDDPETVAAIERALAAVSA